MAGKPLVGDLVNAQESLEIGMPAHVSQLRVPGRLSVHVSPVNEEEVAQGPAWGWRGAT